jgi:hypothetical protein
VEKRLCFTDVFEKIRLPEPAGFATEAEWLAAVRKEADGHSLELSEETLQRLWCLAGQAIQEMGDVFFDPDDYSEFCYGCPDSRGCGGRCDGKYEYSDDEDHRCYRWYGNSGTARLLGLAAVPVLQALLAALLAVRLQPES